MLKRNNLLINLLTPLVNIPLYDFGGGYIYYLYHTSLCDLGILPGINLGGVPLHDNLGSVTF